MTCACGCGGTPSPGKRFIHNHHLRGPHPGRRTRTPHERMWRFVPCAPAASCWLWTGETDDSGYGRIRRTGSDRRYVRAHRLMWEHHHGPVPTGRCVMHACDTPACVNPAHLRLGTWAENNADRAAKKRSAPTLPGAFGEKHHNARLTAEQVRQLRAATPTPDLIRDLSRAWGVSRKTLYDARNGRTWGHLGPS